MNLQDIPITRLIPQRPPFIMVDKLMFCDTIHAETVFTVRPDNILLDNGLLLPTGVLENMAQSCAARIGYVNMIRNEQSICIGLMGEVRECQVMRQPRCGEVLHTTIDIIHEVFNLSLASVKTCVGDEVIAETQMKIAMTEMAIDDSFPAQ